MGFQPLADFAVSHALRLGATYAEARLEESVANAFYCKNGLPQMGGFEETQGLGVRLIFHGAVEHCSTDWMDKQHVGSLVEKCLRSAAANARLVKDPVLFSTQKPARATWAVPEKRKIANVHAEEKVKLLASLDKSLGGGKAAVPTRLLFLGDNVIEKYYVNSEGSRIRSRAPSIEFFAVYTVQEAGGTLQRHIQRSGTGGYELLKAWKLEDELEGEAAALARVLREGVRCPEGPVDIVCGPEVVGIACHESVGHPFEADRILGREGAQAGESFLSEGDVGMRLGSDAVTVVDDPSIPGSAGYYQFDDEGVKARKKQLLVNGVAAEFLSNRETAYRLGLDSNGSARAACFTVEPLVRMSNTFLSPGDHADDELFEGVTRGVYLKTFGEWNIDDKRVNQKYASCEAYLIENGEVTKPVKRAVIETTTKTFWGAVDAVGKKVAFRAGTCGKGEPMQGIPVWLGGPHARLRGMRLGV